ncbi:MAG: hypothetical protein M1840_002163 [Geoglossum simile]|nr:MAG: hypothetical protein M1840_002163 [Geoglossum simile]
MVNPLPVSLCHVNTRRIHGRDQHQHRGSAIDESAYPGPLRWHFQVKRADREVGRRGKRGRRGGRERTNPPEAQTGEPTQGDQTPTSHSEFPLDQRTRLTPSVKSSQRSRSPAKELQLQIRHLIDIRGPESGQASIPPVVRDLQRRLSKDFGARVIPRGLMESLHKKSPHAFENTPTYVFDDYACMTDEELRTLWGTVCAILKNAADCQENKRDENAWCMLVVQQALLSGITTAGDDLSIIHDEKTPVPVPGILELNSIQSQSIDPRFLPALPNSNKPPSKKADFALAFNKANAEVNRLYRSLSFSKPHLQLSQMTDTYTRHCAMFAGLEVKAPGWNGDEGVTQLAIRLAAGLNSIQELQKRASRTGTLLPMVGWVVTGHSWNLYIAHKCEGEGQTTTVLGPYDLLHGSTASYHSTFMLINLVKRLNSYVREVYWPWLAETILQPLCL